MRRNLRARTFHGPRHRSCAPLPSRTPKIARAAGGGARPREKMHDSPFQPPPIKGAARANRESLLAAEPPPALKRAPRALPRALARRSHSVTPRFGRRRRLFHRLSSRGAEKEICRTTASVITSRSRTVTRLTRSSCARPACTVRRRRLPRAPRRSRRRAPPPSATALAPDRRALPSRSLHG